MSGIRMHHFNWAIDGYVVDMSKAKCDQAGENITPKNIYGNHYDPNICPILALALHVFGTCIKTQGYLLLKYIYYINYYFNKIYIIYINYHFNKI